MKYTILWEYVKTPILYFGMEDKLEVDHIYPKIRGGKDGYNNWQLLHAHCHHQKTAKDEELRRLEALMSTANLVRSRMRVTSKVRFWRDVQSRVFNKIDWKVRSLPREALFSAPT